MSIKQQLARPFKWSWAHFVDSKRATKMFTVYLPAIGLLALAAYVVLGALPGVSITGDLVATIYQTLVFSVSAFAAIGIAWFFHSNVFRELRNSEEGQIVKQLLEAKSLNEAAPLLLLLVIDFSRWFAPLCLFAWFFRPAR